MTETEKAMYIICVLERIDREIDLEIDDVIAKCSTSEELDFYYRKLVENHV